MKLKLNRIAPILIILCFLIYSIIIFMPAFKPGNALYDTGDGSGTIGCMQSYSKYIKENGYLKIFNPEIHLSDYGMGKTKPFTLNIVWRVLWGVIPQFVNAATAYHIIAVIGFFLILSTTYLLLREFNINRWLAICGALLFANIDNFYIRSGGHIALAIYFAVPLITWAALRAGKNPKLSNFLLLAACSMLNILINEYIGFFGLIYSGMVLLLTLVCYQHKMFLNKSSVFSLFKNFAITGIVFTAAMLICFYNVFLPLITSSSAKVGTTIIRHDSNEFAVYSVDNPLSVFTSRISFIHNLFSDKVNVTNVGEFASFRIGTILPIIVLFGVLSAVVLWATNNKRVVTFLKNSLIAFGSFVPLFLVSLNPNIYKGISLNFVLQKLAPMLRVSARAYIYFDLAVIMVGILTLHYVFEWYLMSFYSNRNIFAKAKNILCLLGISALIYFAMCDTAPGYTPNQLTSRISQKCSPRSLPDNRAYQKLAKMPDGWVLELPYNWLKNDPWSLNDYVYSFSISIHKKPLVNGVRDFYVANYFTNISEEKILRMSKAGVKYIVINENKSPEMLAISSFLESHAELSTKIASDSLRDIYEISVNDLPKIPINELFVYEVDFNGFNNLEIVGDKYWRWCENDGKISIQNNTNHEITLMMVSDNIDSLHPSEMNIFLNHKIIKKLNLPYYKKLEIKLKLPVGKSELLFDCKKPGEKASPQDKRTISFCLTNFSFLVPKD